MGHASPGINRTRSLDPIQQTITPVCYRPVQRWATPTVDPLACDCPVCYRPVQRWATPTVDPLACDCGGIVRGGTGRAGTSQGPGRDEAEAVQGKGQLLQTAA